MKGDGHPAVLAKGRTPSFPGHPLITALPLPLTSLGATKGLIGCCPLYMLPISPSGRGGSFYPHHLTTATGLLSDSAGSWLETALSFLQLSSSSRQVILPFGLELYSAFLSFMPFIFYAGCRCSFSGIARFSGLFRSVMGSEGNFSDADWPSNRGFSAYPNHSIGLALLLIWRCTTPMTSDVWPACYF